MSSREEGRREEGQPDASRFENKSWDRRSLVFWQNGMRDCENTSLLSTCRYLEVMAAPLPYSLNAAGTTSPTLLDRSLRIID